MLGRQFAHSSHSEHEETVCDTGQAVLGNHPRASALLLCPAVALSASEVLWLLLQVPIHSPACRQVSSDAPYRPLPLLSGPACEEGAHLLSSQKLGRLPVHTLPMPDSLDSPNPHQ